MPPATNNHGNSRIMMKSTFLEDNHGVTIYKTSNRIIVALLNKLSVRILDHYFFPIGFSYRQANNCYTSKQRPLCTLLLEYTICATETVIKYPCPFLSKLQNFKSAFSYQDKHCFISLVRFVFSHLIPFNRQNYRF